MYPCLHRNYSWWIPGNEDPIVIPAAILHFRSWIVWRLIIYLLNSALFRYERYIWYQIGKQSMAIMDLLYIHGFSTPLSTCSYELSPCKVYLLVSKTITLKFIEISVVSISCDVVKIKTKRFRDANNSGTMPVLFVKRHFECPFMEIC